MKAGESTAPRFAPSDEVVAWRGRRPIIRRALLEDAAIVAGRLPAGVPIVNDCADRYRFLVVFVATLIRRLTMLLPGDRSQVTLARLAGIHPGLVRVTDSRESTGSDYPPVITLDCDGTSPGTDSGITPSAFPIPDNIVAKVFTSGSTGTPTANDKSWGNLVSKAILFRDYLEVSTATKLSIAATVPPQHMYGFECSVLTPLLTRASVHVGRPLLPPAVAAALAVLPEPRVLVTTPLHLHAIARSRVALPALERIVSATAPLDRDLARTVESLYDTRLVEIYGFTEAGIVASRRTAETDTWTCRADISIVPRGEGIVVEAPHLSNAVPMSDVIEILSPHSFRLLGRCTDLVKIAGKRTSLAGLNAILRGIEGIRDGILVMPSEDDADTTGRLLAFVVAPGLATTEIRRRLRSAIDPVFLPRRIHVLDAIPRSDTGKVTRATVDALMREFA